MDMLVALNGCAADMTANEATPVAGKRPPSPFLLADILETLHDEAYNDVASHACPDKSAQIYIHW